MAAELEADQKEIVRRLNDVLENRDALTDERTEAACLLGRLPETAAESTALSVRLLQEHDDSLKNPCMTTKWIVRTIANESQHGGDTRLYGCRLLMPLESGGRASVD